jgi:hypothetical protein
MQKDYLNHYSLLKIEITNSMIRLKTLLENKKTESFDRLSYYVEYFKNLSPKGFIVKKSDDEIIIKIKKK